MDEIGLQELIFQIKQELLAPNAAQRAKDPYPLFFIDKVELEVAVKVTRSSSGGIKLSVLNFVEADIGKSIARERGHVIKIALSPLLSREEIVAEALGDPCVREMIRQRSSEAMIKGEASYLGESE